MYMHVWKNPENIFQQKKKRPRKFSLNIPLQTEFDQTPAFLAQFLLMFSYQSVRLMNLPSFEQIETDRDREKKKKKTTTTKPNDICVGVWENEIWL